MSEPLHYAPNTPAAVPRGLHNIPNRFGSSQTQNQASRREQEPEPTSLRCNTPANYPQMGHPHSSPGCWGPLPSWLGGGSFPAPAVPPWGAAAAALLRDGAGRKGRPPGVQGQRGCRTEAQHPASPLGSLR